MVLERRDGCRLQGQRVIVRLPQERDVEQIARYFTVNREHLSEFAPAPPEFRNAAFWRTRVDSYYRDLQEDRAFKTFIFALDDIAVIGSANLSEFVRGPFQAAYLGYAIGKAQEGQGLMREALTLLISFAFETLALHRIMANYMPRNARSAAVLQRLGFVQEGLARKYLLINGVWEDHVLTSLTNTSWQSPD